MSNDSPSTSTHTTTFARCLRGMFVVTVILVSLAAHFSGQTYTILVFSLLLTAVLTIPSRLWSAVRHKLVYDFVRRPLSPDYRKYLWQFVLRVATYAMGVACLLMAVPRVVMSNEEFLAAILVFGWIPAGLLMLLQLFPAKHVSRSVNLLHAVAAGFLGIQLLQVYVQSRFSEPVVIQSPFRGEWVVFQGGRSSLINHHYLLKSQRHALDLLRLEDGKHVQGDRLSLESYACFDQPLYAPASGSVVKVVNDRPEQEIGTGDVVHLVGNVVVIDMGHDRFVLLAHLREGSVVVAEGDEVEAGDLVARCGNSGNTSEPHLHLQIQNRAEFYSDDLVAYPIRFENVTHVRGGRSHKEQQGELNRNDRIISQLPEIETVVAL